MHLLRAEMKMKKTPQLLLLLVAMALVGSVYGWSTTVAVLAGSAAWSLKGAASDFGILSAGIGLGVVISGRLLPTLGNAATITAGLVTYGLAQLLLSEFGLSGDSRTFLAILPILAGAGAGIAYLALVKSFRTSFAR